MTMTEVWIILALAIGMAVWTAVVIGAAIVTSGNGHIPEEPEDWP